MTIKNGDMPAMPTDVKTLYEAMTDKQDSWGKAAIGMTKREMMAMHALNGLLSDGGLKGSPGSFADAAVSYADALLAELERTQ